jgi:NADPH:quinone reductase-like Zn-dependent oxidoreductase
MQAITVRDRDAGVGGLTLTDLPYPHAAENDVIVRVHAAGFTPGAVRPLTETADAFARHRRTTGKTIIQIARDHGGERP